MDILIITIIVISWAITAWALAARREAATAQTAASTRAQSLEAANVSLRRQIQALRPQIDELAAIKAQRASALSKANAARQARAGSRESNPAQAKAAAKKG